MPEIITKEDGTKVELFSKEELDAKNTELEKAKSDLKTTEETLAKLQGKDLNFEKLREQKEAAEKKITELKNDIDSKIGAVKKEILEGVTKDHYNDALKSLSGEDAELKKKIEFQYDRIKDVAGTKEEVSKKLRDAFFLATKKEDDGALNASVISSGGVGRLNVKSNTKLTPEEKALGAKMGLKEEDFAKYGG